MSTAARDGNPLDDQQRREARRQFFREFWPKQRRRGNAFRDSLYESIKARGLTEAKGWTTEKKSPIKGNDRPDRFLDIFNGRLHVGVETKLGGGERERVLDQIRNDLDAVRAGHERFWVHNDLSRLKDNRVLRGLRAMEKRYPEKFALVDASDPASVAAFRQRFPRYQAIADAIPEARAVFNHYDAQYNSRTIDGRQYSISDARSEWLQARQLQQRATIGMRPAVDVTKRNTAAAVIQDRGRPTPATEVSRRGARTAGRGGSARGPQPDRGADGSRHEP